MFYFLVWFVLFCFIDCIVRYGPGLQDLQRLIKPFSGSSQTSIGGEFLVVFLARDFRPDS